MLCRIVCAMPGKTLRVCIDVDLCFIILRLEFPQLSRRYQNTKNQVILLIKVDPQISCTFRFKRLTLCKFSGSKNYSDEFLAGVTSPELQIKQPDIR